MTASPRKGSPLSPHEIKVVAAASLGKTDLQIAHELHISESTVKTRLRHAGIKLGTRGRAGTACAALRTRVIE